MLCELFAAKQLSALAGSCLHGQHSKPERWPPGVTMHTMREDVAHHSAAVWRG